MNDQDMDGSLNKEQMQVEIWKCKKRKWENTLNDLKIWVQTITNKETPLYYRMVSKYYRLMKKCEDFEKILRWKLDENDHFKLITHSLINKIEVILGMSVEACNDEATYLEEGCKTLTDGLSDLRRTSERLTDGLIGFEDRLARSKETVKCLKDCLDVMKAMSEEDQTSIRRDEEARRNEAALLSDELDDVKRGLDEKRQKVDQLRSAMSELLMANREDKLDAVKCVNSVRKINVELTAALETRRQVEATLRAKIVSLEEASSGETSSGETSSGKASSGEVSSGEVSSGEPSSSLRKRSGNDFDDSTSTLSLERGDQKRLPYTKSADDRPSCNGISPSTHASNFPAGTDDSTLATTSATATASTLATVVTAPETGDANSAVATAALPADDCGISASKTKWDQLRLQQTIRKYL